MGNRLLAIDDELSGLKEGSDDAIRLEREKAAIIKQLTEAEIAEKKKAKEEEVKDAEKAAAKQIELQKKIQKAIFDVLTQILDKITENQAERVKEAEEAITKQDAAVDSQRNRAEQGLSNTLAFEQRERAKAELELQKQQKRLEKAEKVKSLFASYTANANNPELSKIPGWCACQNFERFRNPAGNCSLLRCW